MSFKATFFAASSLVFMTSSAAEVPDCPGAWVVASNQPALASGACCVAGVIPDSAPLSVCEGWPICEGPTTIFTETMTSTPLSCATIVPTGSDYSSELAEVTSSLSASGTKFDVTITGDYSAQSTWSPDNDNDENTGNNGKNGSSITGAAATDQIATGGQPGSSGAVSSKTTTTTDSGSGAVLGHNLDFVLVTVGSTIALAMGGAALWL